LSRTSTALSRARRCLIPALDTQSLVLPRFPYRGIQPFGYGDHLIFFARERETRDLLRHTVVYRGVALYGESGAGKSSLINAGLLAAAALEGFRADRVRVQPRAGEEIVVERIPTTGEPDAPFLPSSFAGDDGGSPRIVLPADTLRARLEDLGGDVRPLLVFDQFEELVTLFEETPDRETVRAATAVQQRIVDVLVDLLRDDTLSVKLLFVFREDYLAKVRKLLAAYPELIDHSLRLASPGVDALHDIVRGPFERYPGRFDPELPPGLADRLAAAIAERSGTAAINLSEVQVVCLRLWSAQEPEALFDEKGVQGLLEDYLWSSLNEFPEELRVPAVALLSEMVTPSGARNVISAEDLVDRVRSEHELDAALLDPALAALEERTRLVRRERRRDLYLYEITSEFLVPWIRGRQEELIREREREKLAAEAARRARERRNRAFRVSAVVLLVVASVLAAATIVAVSQRRNAVRLVHVSRSQRLAELARVKLALDPVPAILTGALAFEESRTPEAAAALQDALATTGIVGLSSGEGGSATAVAFGPRGSLVVTAFNGGAIRIWRPRTGHVRVLRTGWEEFAGVAVSRDGKELVAGADDGNARVWDLSSGKVIAVLRRSRSRVLANDEYVPFKSADFSRDGRRVLAVAGDGYARVWDVRTRRLLLEVLGAGDALINAAAFDRDGARVVVASDDRTARVWDVAMHEQAAVFRGRGLVLKAAFTPDGTHVLTTELGGATRLWTIATAKLIRTLTPPRNRASTPEDQAAAFSPDGRRALTNLPDGVARLWNVATGEAVALQGNGTVSSATFSPDGTLLVTIPSRLDGTAQVWDARTGASVAVLRGEKQQPLFAVAFSADSRSIATANAKGIVIVWRVRSGTRVGRVGGPAPWLTAAAFSRDGRSIIGVGGAFGRRSGVRIWDLRTKRVSRVLRGMPSALDSATLSPRGTYAITIGEGVADLWDVRSGRRISRLESDGKVEQAAFSLDERRLVTQGAESPPTVWSTADGTRLTTFRLTGGPGVGRPGRVTFSPDGKRVLAVRGSVVFIWSDRRSPPVELAGHNGDVNDAAFSADGQYLVTASSDNTALLWFPSGQDLADLSGHTGPVRFTSFSRDSTRIVTASDDGSAIVWSQGGTIERIFDQSAPVLQAAFSPDKDGRYVLTTNADGTARVESMDTGATCVVLGRDPSRILAARFEGVNRVAFVTRDGVVRTASVGSCGDVRSRALRDAAAQLLGNLTEFDRFDLLASS